MRLKHTDIQERLWGAAIFATIMWLTFLSNGNTYVRFIRSLIEPIACLMFPENTLLLSPIIYWAVVFFYVLISSPEKMKFRSVVKHSFVEMFRGAISVRSSQAVASTVVLVVFMFSYWCRFPVVSH